MIVIGGYNSSNTCNLARICAARVRTYHIADPECLVSPTRIRHRPIGAPSTTQTTESMADGWLPRGTTRRGTHRRGVDAQQHRGASDRNAHAVRQPGRLTSAGPASSHDLDQVNNLFNHCHLQRFLDGPERAPGASRGKQGQRPGRNSR